MDAIRARSGLYFCPDRGQARHDRQRGWSLPDLLLGMGVSLFLAAGAGGLMLSQWREYKHLLAETLLQQELRNAMALIRHEVHRSGADPVAHELVPERAAPASRPPESTRLQLLRAGSPVADDLIGDGLKLAYGRSEAGGSPRRIERGIRLQGSQLQYLLERSWQPWNDSNAVRFNRLELRLAHSGGTSTEACTCKDGLESCDARLQGQTLHVLLVGQSVLDRRTVRSLSSSIHVRNRRLEWPAKPC